jgi:hypothetical protein
MKNKNLISALILVVGIGASAGYYFYTQKNMGISVDEAKAKAEKFVAENLVQPGTSVSVKGVTKENGLYKLDLKVDQQEIVAYMTKDGKGFFPQMMDMAEFEKQKKDQQAATEAKANVEVPKNEKPSVEAFIMSYCPYGTQIEKGLLPVLKALGNKIDFKLKFVDYAMHEKKELDENLVQYCVQKNEPAKLITYLECFLKKEDSSKPCLSQSGINQTKLDTCVSETDKQFGVTEKYNDKSTWSNGSFPPFDVDKTDNEKYGVQGSPTFVVNGVQVEAQRDPASLLATICKGFSNQPQECAAELSSTAPAPGFGEGTVPAASSDAGCAN